MTDTNDKIHIEDSDCSDAPSTSSPASDDEGRELRAALEAILFAAGHPVSYEKLSAVLGVPEYTVRTLADSVAVEYNSDDSPHGIMMLTFDDGCQLCTKERFAPLIKEALGIRRGGNLSASSLEVLAIIAYNQPCTRTYVDTVRGVDSGYIVSSLTEKGLIEQRGRLDVPGRPMLYGTTDAFLRVFGISSVDELPAVALKGDGGDGEQIPVSESELL